MLHFDFYHHHVSLLSSGPGCICLYFAANQPPDVREALIRAMIAGLQPSADAKCFPHSFTSSVPYSQTAPAVALLPLCLKGCLIFFLSGQSELPERRLSVYICPPAVYSCVAGNILLVKVTLIDIEFNGCVYRNGAAFIPLNVKDLSASPQQTRVDAPALTTSALFRLLSQHCYCLFTFNYKCPSVKQPAG